MLCSGIFSLLVKNMYFKFASIFHSNNFFNLFSRLSPRNFFFKEQQSNIKFFKSTFLDFLSLNICAKKIIKKILIVGLISSSKTCHNGKGNIEKLFLNSLY